MKKTLALLLCVLMLVSLLPVSASAELEDGYYLVGAMTSWGANAAYKFSGPDSNGIYSLSDVAFTGDCKAAWVSGGALDWNNTEHPCLGGDDVTPNYSAATADVYFKPGSGEFLRFVNHGVTAGYYLVGNMTDWQPDSAHKFVNTVEGVYYLDTTLSTAGTEGSVGVKVVSADPYGSITWLGSDNYDPGIDGAACVYFAPGGGMDAPWHEGSLYADTGDHKAADGYYFIGNVEAYTPAPGAPTYDRNWTIYNGFKLSAANSYAFDTQIAYNAAGGTDLYYKAVLYLGGTMAKYYPADNQYIQLTGAKDVTYRVSMPAGHPEQISVTRPTLVRFEPYAGDMLFEAPPAHIEYKNATVGDTVTVWLTDFGPDFYYTDLHFYNNSKSEEAMIQDATPFNVSVNGNTASFVVPSGLSGTIYINPVTQSRQYPVTVMCNTGGSVTVDYETRYANGVVKVTSITANEGYRLVSLEITDKDDQTVSKQTMVDDHGYLDVNGTSCVYYFNMPSGGATVTATFEAIPSFYLVTSAAPTTLDAAKQFTENTRDTYEGHAPYILEGQSFAVGTQVKVVRVELGQIVASYPAEGYFTVTENYSDYDAEHNSYSQDIDVRFDPAGNVPDHNTDYAITTDPVLKWSAFPGAYFAWEAYGYAPIWLNMPAYAVTVSDELTLATVSFTTESDEGAVAHVGETVTLSMTDVAEGYTFVRWDVKKGNTPVTVTNNQFVMPAGPVTINALFTADNVPILRAVNLTLDGTIGVTFKVKLPAAAPSAGSLRVELYDEGVKKSESLLSACETVTENNVLYYLVKYNYPARLINNQLTIKLVNTQNETCTLQGATGTAYPDGYTTTVAACCDLYANYGGAVETLATALKIYGNCAHACLDFETIPDPDTIAKISAASENAFANLKLTRSLANSGVKVSSMYLTLDTDTAINLRFALDTATNFDGFTFKLGDTELPVKVAGSTRVVTIPNIAANDLDTVKTVTVYLNGSEVGTASCSALYYGKLAMKNGDDSVKYMVRALYDYNVAANNYQ